MKRTRGLSATAEKGKGERSPDGFSNPPQKRESCSSRDWEKKRGENRGNRGMADSREVSGL